MSSSPPSSAFRDGDRMTAAAPSEFGHAGHAHPHASSATGSLRLAFGLTAVSLVVEVVAGLASGSLALIADAGHILTDDG